MSHGHNGMEALCCQLPVVVLVLVSCVSDRADISRAYLFSDICVLVCLLLFVCTVVTTVLYCIRCVCCLCGLILQSM